MMAGYKYQGDHQGPDTFDAVALKPPYERNAPRPRVLQPCGTPAAYKRHQAHGEDPCAPCTKAALKYRREHDANRKR